MIKKIIQSVNYRSSRVLKPILFNFKTPNVVCNICGWKDFKFESNIWHPKTICSNCRSQIRHRLFWAVCTNNGALSIKNLFEDKKIIHFAPDKCLIEPLSKICKEYITADFFAEGYSYENIKLNMDISDMNQVGDQEIDGLMAFDVLEHVKDDLKAIEETNRILKIGGYCIFMIPEKDGLDETYEDLSDLSSAEREKKFGQWDHWRIYGSDFKKRLEERGFEVTVFDAKSFEKNDVQKHVLFPSVLSTHPLATNYRHVYFGKKIEHVSFS